MKEMDNPYAPNMAVIKEIIKETPDTNTYVLCLKEKKFNFRAGQFVMLSLFGVGEAAISICSAPAPSKEFALTFRKVGMVTDAIFNLKEGDKVWVRGPYGNGWPIEKIEGKDLLLVVGGCGCGSFRSLLMHIFMDRERYGNVEILYGTRTPADQIYAYEHEKWRSMPGVRLLRSVEKKDGQKWDEHIGLVTSLFPFIKTKPDDSVVFTCGPEIMMKFVGLELIKKGFSEEQIYLSMERRMRCGIGKCGHCQMGTKYVCKDGPVFCYSEVKKLPDNLISEV